MAAVVANSAAVVVLNSSSSISNNNNGGVLPSPSSTKRRLSAAAAHLFRHPLLLLSSSSSPKNGSSPQQQLEEESRFAAYKSQWYRPDKMPSHWMLDGEEVHSHPTSSHQPDVAPSKTTLSTIHHFTLHKEIGSGRYGKVYLATSTNHSAEGAGGESLEEAEPLALKVMEKRDAFLDELEHLLNFKRRKEASSATTCCPFLVQLVSYCELRYVNALDKEASRYLLATRLAEGGSLRNLMRTQLKGILRLTEAQVAFYLLELTEALTFLHSLGVVHQDVKPDNVLLGADGHVVLADFGLATLTSRPYAEYWGNIVCKSNHMPPEVHRNESAGVAEKMNHSVDWFSLGVLLFRLGAACYPPTPRHSAEEWKLAFKKFRCSRPLAHLLQSLMQKDYKVRLGSSSSDGAEIFSHPFVKRVLPSVLVFSEDGASALQSVATLRELICEKRLRPVFRP